MFRSKKVRLLLIEDEEYDVRRIRNTVKPFENSIIIKDVVASGKAAIDLLRPDGRNYDVVIMDFQIAGNLTGENLIKEIKKIDATLQIIVITKMTINITDLEFANRLMEAGAMWYCTKYPGDIEEYIYQPTDFILSIFNACEKRSIETARRRSEERLDNTIESILSQKKLVGNSQPINKLRTLINKAAQTETNVLINGHSGTGKELVATHIHYNSKRRFEKFVPINCGSLPSELVESELFGFEKGSFTGAGDKKPGLFEVADKGTIFLDEIAELPKSAQVKLLRVIQEGEIDKIGRTKKIEVDVRIIAATNSNIHQAIKEGKFREDLFYRLNVLNILVPRLRDVKSDIPMLVTHYLDQYSRDMSKPEPLVEQKAMDLLIRNDWPGNIRQLQNVIQRLLIAGDSVISDSLVEDALGRQNISLGGEGTTEMNWDPDNIKPLREVEMDLRKSYFNFARKHSDSDAGAARKLGLAPSNFHRMSKELGIK